MKATEEMFCGAMATIKIFPVDNGMYYTKTSQVSKGFTAFQTDSTTFASGTVAMDKGQDTYSFVPRTLQFSLQATKGLFNSGQSLFKVDRFLRKFGLGAERLPTGLLLAVTILAM